MLEVDRNEEESTVDRGLVEVGRHGWALYVLLTGFCFAAGYFLPG